MRLLSLIHGPAFGGAHNQALSLREPLIARGIETLVVLPAEAEDAAERLRAAGAEVVTLPLGRLRATSNPIIQARFAAGTPADLRRLRALIRERGIDLVQVHGATNPQGALAAQSEPGVAVVWQLFDSRAPMPLRRLAAPLIRRHADAVTVWGKRLAAAHPGLEAMADRVVTVYPPLDRKRFRVDAEARRAARGALGVSADAPLVGSVGVLNPQKGHEHLIAAAATLARRRPELRVRIIGASSPAHGGYERRLRSRIHAAALDHESRLELVDPGTGVAALLPALDVFVMTSVPRSEGMPTAILEAMACGIPVVATEVGAVAELVDDNETGLLVPPEEPEAVVAAVDRLLDDPELRRRMGAAAERAAAERFDLDRLADLHASAYEIAIEHRHNRARGPRPDSAQERRFFDASAASLTPAALPPREYAPFDSRFEDAILDACGDLDGTRVLDLGCGSGDLTLRMLDRGASVTGLDISGELVAVARERVERHRPGAPVRFFVAPAEATGLDAGEFDLVVGKWVLHHLDLAAAAVEVRRLLHPGGRGVFVETSGLNPALRFARARLAGRGEIARYGTPDERPISAADIELLERTFDRCAVDFPNFVLLFLIERHLLRWRWPRIGRGLRRLDDAIERRAPWLGRWSYYLRIEVKR